jgi:hypothetical protein
MKCRTRRCSSRQQYNGQLDLPNTSQTRAVQPQKVGHLFNDADTLAPRPQPETRRATVSKHTNLNDSTYQTERCIPTTVAVFSVFHVFYVGATAPSGARASSLSGLHDHTQTHTTLGRTPLDE